MGVLETELSERGISHCLQAGRIAVLGVGLTAHGLRQLDAAEEPMKAIQKARLGFFGSATAFTPGADRQGAASEEAQHAITGLNSRQLIRALYHLEPVLAGQARNGLLAALGGGFEVGRASAEDDVDP